MRYKYSSRFVHPVVQFSAKDNRLFIHLSGREKERGRERERGRDRQRHRNREREGERERERQRQRQTERTYANCQQRSPTNDDASSAKWERGMMGMDGWETEKTLIQPSSGITSLPFHLFTSLTIYLI